MALTIPDIETERLILRGPTEADLRDWIACIWSDAEVMRYMPRMDDTPAAFAKAVLAGFTNTRAQQQVGAWVITNKADGSFMGHCILRYREAVNDHELGYAFGQAFWGKGYATEAARVLARYGVRVRQPGRTRLNASEQTNTRCRIFPTQTDDHERARTNDRTCVNRR